MWVPLTSQTAYTLPQSSTQTGRTFSINKVCLVCCSGSGGRNFIYMQKFPVYIIYLIEFVWPCHSGETATKSVHLTKTRSGRDV